MATVNRAFRVKNGLNVEGAELRPAAGTTTYPPILLTSGTNLTTATAGAFEYDGTNFYLTASTGGRKTIAFTDLAVSQATSTVLGTVKLASDTAQTVAFNTVSATASRSYGLQVNASGQGIVNVPWTDTVYTLPTATATVLGGIELFSGTTQSVAANAVTTTASRTYGLQLNSDLQGVVNVPWTDTVYTLPLATDTVRGGIELFSATQQSVAANTVTTTASRTYGIQLNAADQGVVNVPWTDTDTNYYPSTIVFNAGTTAGPTLDLTMSGAGAPDLTAVAIPSAGTGASGIITTGAQNIDGVKTFSSFPEVSGTPSTTNQLVNKAYVDNLSTGIDWKASVRAATTANGTLASAYANGSVIDNVTLATGNRILIKNQTTGSENGIYTVNATGAPTRATDADAIAEVTSNLAVFVEEGDANADSGWVLTNNGAITIGTTALTFTQFTGIGSFTAGDGLTKTGSTLSVNLDSSPSGLKFNSAKLAIDPAQLWIGTSNVVLSGTTPISQALTGILSITGTVSNMSIQPAARTGIGTGYSLSLTGGATDTSSAGVVSISGGTSTAANAAGGAVTIYGGNGQGSASGGRVDIDGGTSGSGTYGKVNVGTASRAIDIGQDTTPSITRILGTVQLPTVGTSGFVKLGASGQLSQDTNTYLTSTTGVTTVNGASGAITNVALTTGKLSQFASTTSTELAGVVSDETGTGSLVFASSPAFGGTPTFGSGNSAIINASGSTTGTTALTLTSLYTTSGGSANYHGGEFIIKAVNGSNIEITKVLVITNGTDVYMTTYGDVFVTANLVEIDFSSGTTVNMIVTPVAGTTGTTTVKVSGTLVAV